MRREGLDFRALTEAEFVEMLRADLLKASEVCSCGYYVMDIDYSCLGADMWRYLTVNKGSEVLDVCLHRAWLSLRESANWDHGRGWEVTSRGDVDVILTPEAMECVRAERARDSAGVASCYGRGGGSYCGD